MTETSEAPMAMFAMTRPDHVPEELVREYPFKLRGVTTSVLPRTLIPPIHEYPPIFWAEGVHPMLPGAWVPRTYKELQEICQ